MNFLSKWRLAPALYGFIATFFIANAALADDAPKVRFTTSAGDFVVEVYPDKAPKTVENFLQYVRDKHYDGTIFHRVIDNFMVQGGGFDAKFTERKSRPPVAHEGREALSRGGPKKRGRHAGHGAHQRPELSHRPVFHQCTRQRFFGPNPDPARRPGTEV